MRRDSGTFPLPGSFLSGHPALSRCRTSLDPLVGHTVRWTTHGTPFAGTLSELRSLPMPPSPGAPRHSVRLIAPVPEAPGLFGEGIWLDVFPHELIGV